MALNEAPPSARDARDRVKQLLDKEDDVLHAVTYVGSDEEDGLYHFYLVFTEGEFGGNEYLKERYVQLATRKGFEEGRDDTFKTNGINRRVSDLLEMAEHLSRVYDRIAERERRFREGSLGPEEISPMFGDVSPEVDDAA